MTGDEILRAFTRAAVLQQRYIMRSRPVRLRHVMRALKKVTGR